jgi:hypothetical protein
MGNLGLRVSRARNLTKQAPDAEPGKRLHRTTLGATTMTNATVPTAPDVADVASDKLKAINSSMQEKADWKTALRRFVLRRKYVSQRRMLNRISDSIEVILAMLHDLEQNKDDKPTASKDNKLLERIRDHLQLLPGMEQGKEHDKEHDKEQNKKRGKQQDKKLGDIDSSIVCEIESKLKIDALYLAQQTQADGYIYNRLRYEHNLINKREKLRTTHAHPSDVDLPSEELNTAWDLFRPQHELNRFVNVYQHGLKQHGSSPPKQHGSGAHKEEVWRDYAVPALRDVYLSRQEHNRYTATRARIRSFYYSILGLCLVALVGIFILADYLWQSDDPNRHYYLIVISAGAVGSVSGVILRFRDLNRITEFRNTASMLFAQTCVGATAALVFFLILRAGWIEVAFLSEGWSLRDVPPGATDVVQNAAGTEQTGARATQSATDAAQTGTDASRNTTNRALLLAEVILVAFFVGLSSETIFLRLVERVEGLMGQGGFQSPAP